MSIYDEYNPLDYDNLTANLVRELMSRAPLSLPLRQEFTGAGVYALFYKGDFAAYSRISKTDSPIYVGKAVPAGARKGGNKGKETDSKSLFKRIKEHTNSIDAAENLSINDFACRFLVVTPLWITMAERFLIEHYRPAWNVCIEGFGLHDPGKGRHKGGIPWWDALHPGRAWAKRLEQTKSAKAAEERLREFMTSLAMPGDDESEG